MACIRYARIVYANAQDDSRGYPIASLRPTEVTVCIELTQDEARLIRARRGGKSLVTLFGPARRWELPTLTGMGPQLLSAHHTLASNSHSLTDPGDLADRTLETLERALERLRAPRR